MPEQELIARTKGVRGDEQLKTLLADESIKSVTRLDLRGLDLTDAAVAELVASPSARSLSALLVGHTSRYHSGSGGHLHSGDSWTDGNDAITAGSAKSIAGCSSFCDLRDLTIIGRVGDDGLAAIASSPYMANLTALYMPFCGIGDPGVVQLASSPQMAKLTRLGLAFNQISDAGARALLESPYLGAVRMLDLNGNRISPAVREALSARFGDVFPGKVTRGAHD